MKKWELKKKRKEKNKDPPKPKRPSGEESRKSGKQNEVMNIGDWLTKKKTKKTKDVADQKTGVSFFFGRFFCWNFGPTVLDWFFSSPIFFVLLFLANEWEIISSSHILSMGGHRGKWRPLSRLSQHRRYFFFFWKTLRSLLGRARGTGLLFRCCCCCFVVEIFTDRFDR